MRHYRNLVGIFSTVALVILVSILLISLTGMEEIRARKEIQTHLAAIQRLDDFMLTLTTAETGQRGYLMTGKEAYLKPYNDAAPQVRTAA